MGNLFEDFNHYISGKQLAGKDIIPEFTGPLNENVLKDLYGQWEHAGRPAARVFLKLNEANGNNLYITGWDGRRFVGHDGSAGFGFIPTDRIEASEIDSEWDTNTRLDGVRNLSEMTKDQVHSLVKDLKSSLIKSSKDRRASRASNFHKKLNQFNECCEKCSPEKMELQKAIKKLSKKK